MAAPVLETFTETVNSTAGTSCTINVPAGTVDGDWLVLVLGRSVSGIVAADSLSGWTLVSETLATSVGETIWKRQAASEPGSYAPTWTGSAKNIGRIYRFSGASDIGTMTAQTGYSSNNASPTSPAVTTALNDSLVLRHISAQSNGSISLSTPPSGTLVDSGQTSGSGSVFSVAYQANQATAGTTGTATWGLSAAVRSVCSTIVVEPVTASPQTITATAPNASTAAVTSPALSQHLTATAPAASTTAVGAHTVAQALAIAPGAPAASTAAVTSPVLSQHVVATAPAASTATVGTHTVAQVQTITATAPNASTAAVGSHAIEAYLEPWLPVLGHIPYEWQEGAAWTDINIVDDLGLSEASPDIGPAIKAHLDANSGSRIRYVIPAGTWNLATLILVNRDQKRIVGAGSGLTHINVSGVGVIRFQGFDGSTSAISGSPSRGDTTVQVADASIAAVDETITIRQTLDNTVTGTDDNTSPYAVGTIVPESWATQAWEQIVKVTAVDTGSDIITFTPPLALDYDSGKSPEVKRYNNVYDGGIEGVTLNVTLDHGLVALQFDRVRECYARDVKILDHAKMGIQITESHNVEIAECIVDGARDTGTGGNGYGIMAELGSSNIYIHDCMAKDQRHAFLLQSGCSHCIVAYNYSASPSVENLTDLSIHGHMVHHCLFEGNVVHGTVEVNDFYTETRWNVLFRNRVLGNAAFWDATSRDYSFWVRRNSIAAIIGNRCETVSVSRVFDGSEGSLIQLNGNADAPTGIPDSLYLDAKPSYWGPSYVWPPFAGNDANPIPAESLDTLTIAPGAPAASTTAVTSPALTLQVDVGAPATATSSPTSPTLSMHVVAGSPAASTASVVGQPALGQHITATAPSASTTAVGAHLVAQGLTLAPGAPAASTASVTSPALSQHLTATAAAASTASVGAHSIGFSAQAITATAPAASTTAVTSPALSQHVVATAPNASTTEVGGHAISQGLVILSGAPAASNAAVISPTLSQHVAATAPAASTAAVTSPAISQSVIATAPSASTTAVGTASVSQHLAATAPVASTASVGSHVVSQGLVISATAPVASTAAVLNHEIRNDVLIIAATAPNASTTAVGSHALTRAGLADSLSVTIAPAVNLSVSVAPAINLSVSIIPLSGMSTRIEENEVVTIRGTFKEGTTPASASAAVTLKVEHPDGSITTREAITEGATGVYSEEVRLYGAGRHRVRMYSADGRGVWQGDVQVQKNILTPLYIRPTVVPGSSDVISPTVALV